uniref:Reverse transcriptase zinc-binding domain-containing protein n=1 Tax=Arundo donax TaxID=35708 RepID=A0A0A8YG60_ARUDO
MQDDMWAWPLERHGNYSVKSAYRLLASTRQMQEDELLPGTSSNNDWKLIWKLDVPPKVKVFWWRVIHEFLPARQILHKRHIDPIAFCEACGSEEESVRHVLLDCTIARLFWSNAKELTSVKIPKLHPTSWARDLLHNHICSRKDSAVIICGMWTLWMARNKRKHGEPGMTTQQAIFWARDTAYDLW